MEVKLVGLALVDNFRLELSKLVVQKGCKFGRIQQPKMCQLMGDPLLHY